RGQSLYISPSPTQIKSATSNVGTFDPENADIRYKIDNLYHGSGAFFDRFDLNYIGTGEGNQAFGWGIYVTEREGVGRDYAKKLGGKDKAIVYGGKEYPINTMDFGDSDKIAAKAIFALGGKMAELGVYDELPVDDTIYSLSNISYAWVKKQEAKDKMIAEDEKAIRWLKENRDKLSIKKSKNLYTVNVWENHTEDVLDWKGVPTSDQINKINKQLDKIGHSRIQSTEVFGNKEYAIYDGGIRDHTIPDGNDLYKTLTRIIGSPKKASQFLLRAGIDGIKYPVSALSGGKGEKGYNYVVFDDSQITITNHLRYKLLDPDEIQGRIDFAMKLLKDNARDPEKVSSEVAKMMNLDEKQMKEKLGRQIKAAYREGSERLRDTLAASTVAGVKDYVEQNKPEGTDKTDLTFHLDEAENIALFETAIGMSAQDAMKLGADRYGFYLGALRVFSTGNAYVEEMLATEAEIDDLKLKGQTSAALQEKLDLATGMVLQTRAAYENIKGQAGRILNNAREEKGKAVKMFTEIITRIDNEENAIYEEIRQMQAEIDELTKAMDELDGYIAELEKVVEDAIIKPNEKIIAQAEKLLADARNKAVTAGEELAAMRSTRDALSRRVSTRTMEVQSLIDKIKITEERKAEAEKIIDKLNPRSKKPKTITEVELPRPGLTDYVRSVWYNWILSGPVTHAVNIGANLFNAGIEQVIVNTLSDPRGGVSSVKKSILNIPEAMGFNNKPGEMQG
ncbi:MAG TPA: hypothetical protein PL124_11505, partial [Candidatus Cloacimonadota bacterium]|nr:hypothetical protein [Candidatus Cloacimonadota bacterium]